MVARIVDSMTGPLNRQTTILFICSTGQKDNSYNIDQIGAIFEGRFTTVSLPRV